MKKSVLHGGLATLVIAAAAYAGYRVFGSGLGDNARMTDAELSIIPFVASLPMATFFPTYSLLQ